MNYYINTYILKRGAIYTEPFRTLEEAVEEFNEEYEIGEYQHTIKVTDDKAEIINLGEE